MQWKGELFVVESSCLNQVTTQPTVMFAVILIRLNQSFDYLSHLRTDVLDVTSSIILQTAIEVDQLLFQRVVGFSILRPFMLDEYHEYFGE